METQNQPPQSPPAPTPEKPRGQSRGKWALLFGGILPLVAFTVIEDQYGALYGVVAGMIFGVGEMLYEYLTQKKISTITWVSNAMILVLGTISIIFNEGIWFKLQPALIELGFALFLWGSLIAKKDIFAAMAEKQGQPLPPLLKESMGGITFRLGIFFLLHAVLATWAAYKWSTLNWALLKGVGLTGSMIVYMVLELVVIRIKVLKKK